jgi:hypothetical protein
MVFDTKNCLPVTLSSGHQHRVQGKEGGEDYVDILKRDAGVESENELAKCMMGHDVWRIHVRTRLRPP